MTVDKHHRPNRIELLTHQVDQLAQLPLVIGKPGPHRWGALLQRLVTTAPVVVREEDRRHVP